MASVVGRSTYGPGSTTEVSLPSLDLSPIDLARTLLQRESAYLARGRDRYGYGYAGPGPQPGRIGVALGMPVHSLASNPSGLGRRAPEYGADPANLARSIMAAGPQLPDVRGGVPGNVSQYNAALNLLGVSPSQAQVGNVLGPSFLEEERRGPSTYEKLVSRGAPAQRAEPDWWDIPLFERDRATADYLDQWWANRTLRPGSTEWYLAMLGGR